MANNIIKRVWNQNRMVNIEDLSGMVFQAESGGHTFEISGIDDTGTVVALAGTVAGVFMRPDSTDIALTGSASDGVVSVTLDADCYAVPGRFGLTIFVTADDQTVAVYACVGTVSRTSTGGVAGSTPQDVADLVNAIETAIASIPADYSDLLASIAPDYSSSALYPVGSYAWYDGDLYRCTTAITTPETWTAAHWTAAVLSEDVAALNSSVSELDGYFYRGINLFNPDDHDLVENVELKNDGTTAAKTGYFASGYVPVRPGETICMHYPTGTYGTASSIVLYDSQKQRLGYSASGVSRLTDANGHTYIRFTFPNPTTTKYIRVTGYMPGYSYYMYVYAAEMPSTYEPYMEGAVLSSSVKVPFENVQDVAISKADANFIKVAPKNLSDLSKMAVGIIGNSNSGANLDSSVTAWRSTDYIPVVPGEIYTLTVAPGVYYGVGYKGVPYYDSDKAYKGHIVPAGGIRTTANVDTITIPAGAAYIRTSYPAAFVTNPKQWYYSQVFHGSTWTNMYIPYDGADRLQDVGLMPEYGSAYNCLTGKKAMWNGDSICAADNDAQGGWPMRIGAANGMYAKNYGVSGGTIAENTGAAHSVCATLDTMISDFPDADYIIIEGGTNDADILGDGGIGSFDADDFSDAYIQALDRDTFSGALESVFYRLVTQMKGKHIGYLIPQKMGHTEVLVARRRTYFDRAVAIAEKWGIPVLDLWKGLYFNWRLSAHWDQEMTTAQNEAAGNLYLDGQHLTTTGYAIQSPVIAEWMKTL